MVNMASLSEKVVIITGASSGIGEGVAKHFATLGAKLAIFGRRAEKLEGVAAACRELGTSKTEVIAIAGDVRKDEDRRRLIDKTVERFGKLDVLVNNAGILRYRTVSDTSEEDFDDVFDTNLKAVVFLTQLAIPYLKETKGSIVNNSSYVATLATPGVGIYGMTKAAMDMYTECLALDLAPFGVRVNAIKPGVIDTEIFLRGGNALKDDEDYKKFLGNVNSILPIGRYGAPKECAEVVAFLASDAARYVSGQLLYVDGGLHCVSPVLPL